jgi:hypothetical protein
MELNLVADTVLKGRIYPALARHPGRPYTQSWREFEQHWPHTVPLRLQEYCDHHGVKLNLYTINDTLPPNTFYPVGLGFFDFSIDYFKLMGPTVRKRLHREEVRVLFYYHEGDNPQCIKERLDELACNHLLPPNCYCFVSANTAAQAVLGFVYFNDFELWYWQRNEHTLPNPIHREPRERDFVCLNRLHKSWRATAMADMHRQHILDNSYWSYCETGSIVDADNPIEIDAFDHLRQDTKQFLAGAPYYSDQLTQAERNNHSIQESKYFANAYCNIVMETHFDADSSGGTFLTEKTFKPIKHGQLFFVAGPAGSLQLLRDQGYRVFDSVLDNQYDTVTSSTARWEMLCASIAKAKSHLPELFERARADIEHNQQLFLQHKTQRLNILLEQLNESY